MNKIKNLVAEIQNTRFLITNSPYASEYKTSEVL